MTIHIYIYKTTCMVHACVYWQWQNWVGACVVFQCDFLLGATCVVNGTRVKMCTVAVVDQCGKFCHFCLMPDWKCEVPWMINVCGGSRCSFPAWFGVRGNMRCEWHTSIIVFNVCSGSGWSMHEILYFVHDAWLKMCSNLNGKCIPVDPYSLPV